MSVMKLDCDAGLRPHTRPSPDDVEMAPTSLSLPAAKNAKLSLSSRTLSRDVGLTPPSSSSAAAGVSAVVRSRVAETS